MSDSLFDRLKSIRAFVFDVDGVLTDGSMLLLDNGEWLRQMNVKDGYAIAQAVAQRYRLCAMCEHGSDALRLRMEALGLREFYFGITNKLAALERFVIAYEMDIRDVVYIGDDLDDLEAMRAAGIAACPQDAAPEVKMISHYISANNGGEGCVRDVVELVLKSHKRWPVL